MRRGAGARLAFDIGKEPCDRVFDAGRALSHGDAGGNETRAERGRSRRCSIPLASQIMSKRIGRESQLKDYQEAIGYAP